LTWRPHPQQGNTKFAGKYRHYFPTRCAFTFRTVIQPQVDAFYEKEEGGFISQYFFASSEKHPILFLAVEQAMLRLMSVIDVGDQFVPYVTGPGALKNAWILFIKQAGSSVREHHYPSGGVHVGHGNRTAWVQNPGLVFRSWVHGRQKDEAWASMNMTVYHAHKIPSNISCLETLYAKHRLKTSSSGRANVARRRTGT
jgi:hypothetical protein